MLKEVEIPKHIRKGLRAMVKDHPLSTNLRVFGSDTETCHGEPMSLQICGPGSSIEQAVKVGIDGHDFLLEWVDKKTIFPTFWRWIRSRLRAGGVNLCYFHNLNFDIRVLFRDYLKTLYEQNSDISFDVEIDNQHLEVKILFGKVNKASIILRGEPHAPGEPGDVIARLQILDSKAFTQASLERSLKMFGIPQDKLKAPEGLGSINFALLPKNNPLRIQFEDYSRHDAFVEMLLGLKIMEFHSLYSVAPSISLPSYAARVFRRHFMRNNESIPFPPDEVVKAAEKSYHGGKNAYHLDGPAIVEDVCEVDINSAYPHAMRSLPDITRGKYMRVEQFKKDAIGVYCISGWIDEKHLQAKYRLIYDHAFKVVKDKLRDRTIFKDLWHTAYEVEAALAHPAIKITNLWGYIWRPDEGGDNPFRRFVEHFYEKKEKTPKADPHYHFYKIVLNALYGKLVSTIEVRSAQGEDEVRKLREMGVDLPTFIRIDERFDKVLGKFVSIARNWRAGSMYNPFLASMITGHARRYLYELEVELEALHAATDSVKTRSLVEAVPGLGGLKVECYGRCYLFRNKLYLHFSKDSTYCGHKTPPFKYPEKHITYKDGRYQAVPHPKAGQPMVDDDGQHLCKVALHGYKGPLWVLFEGRHRLITERELTYTYTHVVGLREGLRRGLSPCDFIPVTETMRLGEAYVPEDLITFIVKRGGFSRNKERNGGYSGEITMLLAKETGVIGLVNDRGGLPADRMREAAAEAGFISEATSLSEFMELVREYAGSKQKYYGLNGEYSQGDIIYPDPDEEAA